MSRVFLDGSSDARDRQSAVQRFRNEERVRFAVISVTAGGVGLDFSRATAVVFVELPDDPAIIIQVSKIFKW